MKKALISGCLALAITHLSPGIQSYPTIEQLHELSSENPPEAIHLGQDALKLLTVASEMNAEAEILCAISWAYVHLNDLDSAWTYAERAFEKASAADYRFGKARAIRIQGRIYRNRGQFSAAIGVLEQGLETLGRSSISLRARMLNEMGMVYRRQSRYEDALQAHQGALEIDQRNGDQREIANSLSLIGIIYDVTGIYDEALKHHHQALEIRRVSGDRRGVAGSLHNMGILHQKIKDYPEALRLYRQALREWRELGLEHETATTLNSIGAIHELLGNFGEAAPYYRQALEFWERMDNLYDISIGLNNVANIEFYLGNNEEALRIHKRALRIRTDLGDRFGMAGSYGQLARVYSSLGWADSSLIMARQALEIAHDIRNLELLERAYRNLGSLYEVNGYHVEALDAFKNYMDIRDSLFNAESQTVLADLKAQYRAREQQQEIDLLQQSRKVQKLWISLLLGGFTLSLVIVVLLFNRARLRKHANASTQKMLQAEAEQARLRTEAAEVRAKILETENERTMRELQSARDLQLSMLPSVIPDYPLYDIAASMNTATEVGGDYYDFHLSDDGTLTIAIGDATSHGIQAGTIVTATKSLFNLLADDQDLADILTRSSASLRKMNFQKLFMAFALLRLNQDKVSMIGAGMPPALVYRAADKSVEEFPLSGLPLGAFGRYPYRLLETRLNTGDVILLASDGFAELMNDRGEMIGFDYLNRELSEIGDLPPREIIDRFIGIANDWCNCRPFTDDMTFIAVKMR